MVLRLDEEMKDFIEYISQSDEEIYMRNEGGETLGRGKGE